MIEAFGAAFLGRRATLGLTRPALAERARLGQVTISMLELGRSVPRVDNLLKICEGLGGSAAGGYACRGGLIPAVEEDEELRELLAVIRRLDPADRRELLHNARFREMEGQRL